MPILHGIVIMMMWCCTHGFSRWDNLILNIYFWDSNSLKIGFLLWIRWYSILSQITIFILIQISSLQILQIPRSLMLTFIYLKEIHETITLLYKYIVIFCHPQYNICSSTSVLKTYQIAGIVESGHVWWLAQHKH